MNVSLVTGSLTSNGGGVPEAIRQSAQAQSSVGIEVSVLGLQDGGLPLADWAPCKIRALPVIRFPGLPWAGGLAMALERLEPDLVHTHGLWQQPSLSVPRYCKSRGVRWLVSPHGMLDPWALANSRWKKQIASFVFESRHLRKAACLHALCDSEATAIRGYGLINPVCIIPNGVELPNLATNRQPPTDSRPKVLIFLGRLHPKKGLPNALRAWKQTIHSTSKIQNSKFDEWQFVIAGWDQNGHEAELKRLCKYLGLAYAEVPASDFTDNRQLTTDNSASVLFTGPAFGETKDALLRSASAFILPSFSEGLPMSVLEAWSYGLPVLMTDFCNIPEGLAANAAIRIGTDVESIAEGLRELFSLPTTDNGQPTTSLASLGHNGRALVERQFTWPQVAAQMKQVYEWVLGGGCPPSCVMKL